MRPLHALRARPVAVVAVLIMLVAAIWWWKRSPAPVAIPTEQEQVVARRPFSASMSLVGTIVPGDGVDLVAPFDGTIRTTGFAYGDRVTPGQLIVTLDTAEIDQRLGEAETAYLKARQAADEVAHWASGQEASRSRRAADGAGFDLADSQRRLAETKTLLDKGLVARSEYESLQQQVRGQRLALAAAREDYAAVLARGGGDTPRMTALALADARARFETLTAQRIAATMRAPVGGIVVRPPAGKTEAPDAIHAGLPLAKGQLIGTIVQPGALAVAFELDERDVNTVKVGQRVIVIGSGFGGAILQGAVSRVAGQASPTTSAASKASFVAVAKLDPLPPAQAQSVRIGMSGTVTITTFTAPAAIVVPPAAVVGAAPAAQVQVKREGKPVLVPVTVGHVAPDGVEILSGLKPGDTVTWSTAPAIPAIGGAP